MDPIVHEEKPLCDSRANALILAKCISVQYCGMLLVTAIQKKVVPCVNVKFNSMENGKPPLDGKRHECI
jgi:hypothetical protein